MGKELAKLDNSLFPETGPLPIVRKEDRVVMSFPTTGKVKAYDLRAELTLEFITTFSEKGKVWVGSELKKARLWCLANPSKRKTANGMPRFLANWLNKAADKPSYGPSAEPVEDSDDDKARKLELLKQARKRGRSEEPS